MSIFPVDAGRVQLPREVGDFLLDLVGAYQRFAMYPDGHPLLDPAVQGLQRRLDVLFFERASLSIGVTPNGLLISGVAADTSNPVFREFAARLYRSNVGGMKFFRGVGGNELFSLLTVLRDVESQANAAPAHDEPLLQWPHVRLFALNYDYLELIDDDEAESSLEFKLGSGWAARLWVGLVHAGLGDELSDAEAAEVDPAAVAAGVNLAGADAKRDERVLQSLLDFADAVRGRGRAESLALQKHLARFIKGLTPQALDRLLHMGGDAEKRRRFVLDASAALSAGTVVSLVEAAARSSGRSLSPTLLQMFMKLGQHADEGTGAARAKADVALRQRLTSLIESWAERPTPVGSEEYRQALTLLPFATEPSFEPVLVYGPEPQRILLMSFELGVMDAGTRRAVDRMVEQHQCGLLLDLLERTPPDDPVGIEIKRRVYSKHTVTRLLGEEPVDLPTLGRLVGRVGAEALDALLDALTTSKERKVRAKLLELVVAMGPVVGDTCVKRMGGAPWFVQRNLLRILSQLPALPNGFSLDVYVQHVDPRVRHEGLKILLRDPVKRIAALRRALQETDPPTVRLGIMATLDGCPKEVLPLVLNHLWGGQLEAPLRSAAIRGIAPVNDARVLETLVGCTRAKGGFWKFRKLQPKSPEMLEALGALAVHWVGHREADAVLALARRSKDAEIRKAAAPRQGTGTDLIVAPPKVIV